MEGFFVPFMVIQVSGISYYVPPFLSQYVIMGSLSDMTCFSTISYLVQTVPHSHTIR